MCTYYFHLKGASSGNNDKKTDGQKADLEKVDRLELQQYIVTHSRQVNSFSAGNYIYRYKMCLISPKVT